MDERLKKSLEFANYRISLFNRKEDIKTKFNTMLLHSCNGGIFKITTDMICFVKLMLDNERDSVVLIDNNTNPIEITEIPEFYSIIVSKYIEASNYYNFEYNKLRKARTISSIYSIIDEV
jgi:hypothetical protein